MEWYPAVADGSCVEYTERGLQYEELYCIYPWAKKFYMNWELTWRPSQLYYVPYDHTWIPVVCVAVYLASIYYGLKYFENRPAWNLRKPMAAWNLLLSVFSFWGFWRCAPLVVHLLATYGVERTLCTNPEHTVGASIVLVWSLFFVLSKIPELFDTFFIVAQKKKLILLHWYHHATVLLGTWQCFVYHSPCGIIFLSMNYGVHSVMYFYYFLMAVKMKPKWLKPQWITVAQIAQMVVGCITSVMALSLTRKETCWSNVENNTGILLMYFSYFVLFTQFFLNRFGYGFNVSGNKMMAKKMASSAPSAAKLKPM